MGTAATSDGNSLVMAPIMKPVAGLEARVGRGPMEQDHLLAEQGVLGQESATRAEQVVERGK
jgi:hypothetical protein